MKTTQISELENLVLAFNSDSDFFDAGCDERDTPAGWIRVYWPDEVIKLLKTGKVTEISVDHDLG